MTEDDLHQLIETWDIHEYDLRADSFPADPDEFVEAKKHEDRHRKYLEDIIFLDKVFYSKYEPNKSQSFMDVFLRWMDQFNGTISGLGKDSTLSQESRYALILSRKMIFFNRYQMISLLEEVGDKIRGELVSLACLLKGIPYVDLAYGYEPVLEQLQSSLFVPLSDSSHFMEFRHHCLPEGTYSDMVLSNLDILLFAIEQGAVAEIKSKYTTKRNLFIIEDFSGSGTTATKIKKVIANYDFTNIYFCPFIITETARRKLDELRDFASDLGKHFNVIFGLYLGDEYSVAANITSTIWSDDERLALRVISEKYFKSHFHVNGYLYSDFHNTTPTRPCYYGFKDCGLAICFYSNCPNNSLPIIWSDDEGWKPLFKRYEKHSKKANQ